MLLSPRKDISFNATEKVGSSGENYLSKHFCCELLFFFMLLVIYFWLFLKPGMFVVILDGREAFIFKKKKPNLANLVFASRIRPVQEPHVL